MKRFFLPISMLFLVLLATSCNRSAKAIADVAYGYSYAMANYDVDGAAPFCTPETQSTTLEYSKELIVSVGDAYIQSDTPASIEITHIEIQNDTLAVATYHKTTPIKDFEGELMVVNRNGKWLAHAPMKQSTDENTPKFKQVTKTINGKEVVLSYISHEDDADSCQAE
ncbi:MAG: hypothetical protein II532_03775 [Bacteroidales bacterium]|nr:hypothetical protein [Bacteroidales bacterium]